MFIEVMITLIDAKNAVSSNRLTYSVFKTSKLDSSMIFQEPGGILAVIIPT